MVVKKRSQMSLWLIAGPAHAKLIAQKTKGLPKITFSLDKIEAAAVTEARRNVSFMLFGAFKTCQSLLVKGQLYYFCSYVLFLLMISFNFCTLWNHFSLILTWREPTLDLHMVQGMSLDCYVVAILAL